MRGGHPVHYDLSRHEAGHDHCRNCVANGRTQPIGVVRGAVEWNGYIHQSQDGALPVADVLLIQLGEFERGDGIFDRILGNEYLVFNALTIQMLDA